MTTRNYLSANTIGLGAPIVVVVLAAIAIPVELRPLGRATLGFSPQLSDVVENILGFVPLGVIFGPLGFPRAVIAGALISTFAEMIQFVMMHRSPSAVDVASNVIGSIVGIAICRRWRIRSLEVRICRWKAAVAFALSIALVLGLWVWSGDAPNGRGATSPGTLEAHWKFDEIQGSDVLDSAGHGLKGKVHNQPKRIAGISGSAVSLNSAGDYIEFGHSSAFRLVGSMTISAWIKSSSFPVDDAAIVSQHHSKAGYQLDTTVDRGPRTIGFKLINACGELMARYGSTPMVIGRWYHVAGVYNAEAHSLDVYLNGVSDNGFLLGTVTDTQHSSRTSVYVGRRSDLAGHEFAGDIDDVRIYSFALTKAQIAAVMRGETINDPSSLGFDAKAIRTGNPYNACVIVSDAEDARIPLVAAAYGVLVAISFLGLWPSAAPTLGLGISLAAGLVLVPAAAPTLPLLTRWLMPLVSFAGSASVVISARTSEPTRPLSAKQVW